MSSFPPVVFATLQSSIIAGISNVLAQYITARSSQEPFVLDWVPVFQFYLYNLISTPPNFTWQEFLESVFPSYHIEPTKEAIASASRGDEKELDREATEGRLVKPKLNIRTTIIKTILDQTVGCAFNTILFSLFIHGVQSSMAHRVAEGYGGPAKGLSFLLSGGAIRYENVDWSIVWAKSCAEFWGLVKASWVFWPFVSLINFALLKTVTARNLMGSLAGLGWGIYMSMVTA